MARRKLSTRGRVAAAGVSIAVAGALAGFMAAEDHAANATQPTSSTPRSSDTNGAFDDGSGAAPTQSNGTTDIGGSGQVDQYPQYQQPRAQTRTGGS